MPLTTEQRDLVVTELKRIGPMLNLSEDQRQKLHEFMSQASEKVEEFKKANPHASIQDLVKTVSEHRATLRQRLVNFLTPEQMSVWDAEVAKAKEFLGQKAAA